MRTLAFVGFVAFVLAVSVFVHVFPRIDTSMHDDDRRWREFQPKGGQ